jgi:hypothetical protein
VVVAEAGGEADAAAQRAVRIPPLPEAGRPLAELQVLERVEAAGAVEVAALEELGLEEVAQAVAGEVVAELLGSAADVVLGADERWKSSYS